MGIFLIFLSSCYHFALHTIHGKSFKGKNFRGFCIFFTQPRMFSVELFTRLDFSLLKEAATVKVFPLMFIFVLTAKVFLLERFAVYGVVC